MSDCHHHRTLPECKICALETHGGIPIASSEAFTLQRDSGDEQPFHSHDQASRERDARPIDPAILAEADIGVRTALAKHGFQYNPKRDAAWPVIVTNTPRAGETPQQVAVRYRMDVPEGAKDCNEFCGEDCRCGLRDPAPEAAENLAKAVQQLSEGFKENNPKDGVLKACMSWVPLPVLMELCLAMAEGGFKYGGHNYMVAAPRATVYTDGAFRHIYQFKYEGDLDHESKVGLHHISKAIASLVVLRAAQINNHWVDDRPPRAPEGFLVDCNAKMVELAKAFPEPVARYLADAKRGPGRILES